MRTQTLLVVLVMALLCWGFLESAHAQRRGQPVELPEGMGQELVQANCTQCHGLNMIPNSGFTADGWEALIATMVELSEAESKSVANYLATHFPEQPERRPTLVPGDTSIKITEWIVPTLGQRSRDPVEAPDGSIWWTGMWASLVGRLDPQTGKMTEFPLPPTARPHSIVPAADGSIWYTGNGNATVGKLDPETGKVTEYQTQARDPHTAAFHPDGRLYLAISEFPKWRKYLISLSFRDKSSVRPVQVGGFEANIVVHRSTAVRGRGGPPPPWESSCRTRTGPVEADGTVDAQNAPTAPWKTLRVFHELPQGLSHRITHAKPRKAPEWRWETRIDPFIYRPGCRDARACTPRRAS